MSSLEYKSGFSGKGLVGARYGRGQRNAIIITTAAGTRRSRSFRKCFEVFVGSETCSDLFGRTRMHSDRFGYVRKHLEAFGLFGIFSKLSTVFDLFRACAKYRRSL